MRTLARVLVGLLILESAFLVHELGHLFEFQKRGVAIQELSLGIGPLLLQIPTDGVGAVSFRAVPIMAYVLPTEEAGKNFEATAHPIDKILMLSAGVRNSVLFSLVIVLSLQVMSWSRGELEGKALVRIMAGTPLQMLRRIGAFILALITMGSVDVGKKYLFSLGGYRPPWVLQRLLHWNMVLVFCNILPVPGWDMSRIFNVTMSWIGVALAIPSSATTAGFIITIGIFAAIGSTTMAVIETE